MSGIRKDFAVSVNTSFFYKKIFYKKMSLKNPKTLRKCEENFQSQMPGLQFVKMVIVPRAP